MRFLSLSLYQGTYKVFFSEITKRKYPTLVFTPNPEILLHASRDTDFHDVLSRADFLVPDGTGLYLASYMQDGYAYIGAGIRVFFQKKSTRKRYGDLIKGSDLTHDLVHFAQKHDKKILIVDSYRISKPKNPFEVRKKYIQSHMLELLQKKYPHLSLTLFFDTEMSPDALAHYIEIHKIDYVFACTGMKSQEILLLEIFSYLSQDVSVVGFGVGSSFDYLLGLQKRAPKVLQSLGLEWLYRLMLSPRARWSRIVDAVWRFPRSVR